MLKVMVGIYKNGSKWLYKYGFVCVCVSLREIERERETTWDLSSLSCGGEYINNKIKSSKTAQNSPSPPLNKIHTLKVSCSTFFKVILVGNSLQNLIIYVLKCQTLTKISFFSSVRSTIIQMCWLQR